MTNKTTTQGITTETLVSIQIGSDQYAAKIEKVTDQTIKAKTEHGKVQTFRFVRGWWRSTSYRLVIGECSTELDRSF